ARARLQHYEPRQTIRLAAQAVRRPRPHARPSELRRTRVDEALRRAVVEHVRLHAPQPAYVVDDVAMVGQQFAQGHAALAVLGELAHAAEQFGVALDEGEPLPLGERFGDFLAGKLVELRLWFEQFQLARRPGHE